MVKVDGSPALGIPAIRDAAQHLQKQLSLLYVNRKSQHGGDGSVDVTLAHPSMTTTDQLSARQLDTNRVFQAVYRAMVLPVIKSSQHGEW